MAIYQGVCKSFKSEVLQGVHDLTTDVIKIALFEDSASLSADTTAYSATGEVATSGYTAGGATATPTINAVKQEVIVTFADIAWTSSITTARGALIYNSSKANKAIAVLNFGSDRRHVGGVFTLNLPAVSSDFPVLKLA